MFVLEGVSTDVAAFITGCHRLLAALACRPTFSEPEKEMISYYCKKSCCRRSHAGMSSGKSRPFP